jgi:DNA-binding CsgD family transcriptional regulator
MSIVPDLIAPRVAPYRGPERRSTTDRHSHYLAAMLEEIDYGMILLDAGCHVLHANHAARIEIERGETLSTAGNALHACNPREELRLRTALSNAAQRGLRSFLTLANRASVSLIPLQADAKGSGMVLVVLGRRDICETLSVQAFAKCHQLTLAESQVLQHLSAGASPDEIAQTQGVAISTVRTQFSSIRAKVGATSIQELVRLVSTLPPLVNAVRLSAPRATGTAAQKASTP